MKFSQWLLENAPYFHGSPKQFNQFSYTYVGQGNDQEGPGFYFTDKEVNAQHYGKVYKANLTLNKTVPLKGRINRREIKQMMRWAPDLEDTLTNWAENPNIAFQKAFDVIVNQNNPHQAFMSVWYDFYRGNEALYLQNMTKLGYDGVIIPQPDGSNHVVMFSPDKIQIVQD